MKINLLFLGKFYLVADDISVLDFILNEGLLQLHSLDHTRLDFLLRHYVLVLSNPKTVKTYLVELDGR